VLLRTKFDHSLYSNKIQKVAVLGHDPFIASPEAKLKTLGNTIEC